MQSNCVICNELFDHIRKDTKVCPNKECRRVYTNQRYAQRYLNLYKKTCKYCKKLYEGSIKSVCCSSCKPSVNKVCKSEIEKSLVCPRCNKELGTVIKKAICPNSSVKSSTLCSNCINLSREKLSLQRKLKNPNSLLEFTSEEEYLQYQVESKEKKTLLSMKKKNDWITYMRANNPMFNPSTRLKVSQTTKKKIKEGALIYPTGIDHHLFKGNRSINKYIRASLNDWTKDIKIRDDFTCLECGNRGGKLHTHHCTPLRDIIKLYNTSLLSGKVSDIDQSLLKKLVDDVVNHHYDNHTLGETLCKTCHSKIDSYYKGNNEKNKQNRDN